MSLTFPKPPAWQDDAACAGMVDDAAWFPDSKRVRTYTRAEVLRTCGGCPVSGPCLEYAISNHLEGIWAGTDEERRTSIVRSRGRKSRRIA